MTSRRPIRVLELRAANGAGGGPEKTIFNGASLSSPKDFDIQIIYLKPASDTSTALSNKAGAMGLNYREISGKGPFDFGQYRRLTKLAEVSNFDIVHSHDYKSNLFAWLLGRRLPVKLISTAHGWTGHSAKERMLYYPGDRWILRSFPRIISVSGDITKTLIKSGVNQSSIRTVVNAIDPVQFCRSEDLRNTFRKKLGLNADEIVIGSCGRLAPQKRFDLLLRACKRVRENTQRPIRVLIAGSGNLESELRKQIDSETMTDYATLVGHIEDVRSFYPALDLFVQSSDYEGTSNAILEAMAMEVPIVTTDAGGTRDMIDDKVHGLIVPLRDIGQMAAAIESVILDPELAHQLVARSRHKIENELAFSKRNGILEQLYRELVQN